jgi:hypothetical protein
MAWEPEISTAVTWDRACGAAADWAIAWNGEEVVRPVGFPWAKYTAQNALTATHKMEILTSREPFIGFASSIHCELPEAAGSLYQNCLPAHHALSGSVGLYWVPLGSVVSFLMALFSPLSRFAWNCVNRFNCLT